MLLFHTAAAKGFAVVDFEKDSSHIALWKLFHILQPAVGKTWEHKVNLPGINGFRLTETETIDSQHFTRYIFRLDDERLRQLKQTHEVRISVLVDRETKRVIDAYPSLVFSFPRTRPLEVLQDMFHDECVVGRMTRLDNFRVVLGDELVESIVVTYQELRNRHLRWACNGFAIKVQVEAASGFPRSILYHVGSQLDPFVDAEGKQRDQEFISKDALIDPEEGPECELESSGSRVFLRRN